jgi:ABC-type transport system involved in multi-copper enzyme maturation permease subunit
MCTAWLVLAGAQRVRDLGDLARFGMILFQILAPLQLVVASFSAALLGASAVAQEKDRRTLILLLLTHLTNSELVLGRLLASLLNVLVLLTAALPLFALTTLLGGVAPGQILRVSAVTLASVLVCGSLGSTIAFWREKTFQSLALTVLAMMLWLAAGQIVASGSLGASWGGISTETWAIGLSPWQAILESTRPYAQADLALGWIVTPINLYLLISIGLALALNGIAVFMVRVWNPSREEQPVSREDETWHRQSIWGAEYDAVRQKMDAAAEGTGTGALPIFPHPNPLPEGEGDRPSRLQEGTRPSRLQEGAGARGNTRHVWDNPIIWREICTWAYGRRILIIRVGYLLLFALAVASLVWMMRSHEGLTASTGAAVLVPLFLLSLILVNAQAVTSLTSEKDVKALDLLLVSDLSPKEFVYGKLGGVFYNTKEMVLLPMGLCVYLWWAGVLGLESLVYLLIGLAVLNVFAAMLGVHAGMTYNNSRNAIAASLGTVFFLFVGVSTCLWMMVAFSGSFEAQLPFLGLLVFGGAGLYLALGVRNPSAAIGIASFLCPLATFYAITSLLVSQVHLAFIAIAVAYAFTTIALLVPAVDEFDVATGRTTIWEQ